MALEEKEDVEPERGSRAWHQNERFSPDGQRVWHRNLKVSNDQGEQSGATCINTN